MNTITQLLGDLPTSTLEVQDVDDHQASTLADASVTANICQACGASGIGSPCSTTVR